MNLNTLHSLLQNCKHLSHLKRIHASLLKLSPSLLSGDPHFTAQFLSAVAASADPTLFSYARSILHPTVTTRPNTFVFNTVIRGCVQARSPVDAVNSYLHLFLNPPFAPASASAPPNNYTFPPLLKACTLLLPNSPLLGPSIHAHVVRFGLSCDAFVQSALVEFYSSNADMPAARKVFDASCSKDVVLWTAITDGFAKCGDIVTARKLFDEMPQRNTISWSVMIVGYNRASDFREALALFRQMQGTGVRPNESILVSVLTACAHLGALVQGLWVHSYTKIHGLDANPIVGTALMDMYAKCGCLDSALAVFEGIMGKDTGAWNAIISGAAMNGNTEKSLELFARMCANGTRPNEVTFVAILSACVHAGFVEQGIKLFGGMSEVHGIAHCHEHYACMVNLLARAGRVEEAERFVEEEMGGLGGEDAHVWGALLNACRIYKKVEVGNRVWEKLAKLKLGDCGVYVLVYNIYKEAGWEKEANGVRRLIEEEGLKKQPGCSMIEVDGHVEEFVANDFSHPQAMQLVQVLYSLNNVIR